MTKEELIAKLDGIVLRQVKASDVEADHGDADDLLLAFIDDEQVSASFHRILKWYA